MLVHLTLTVLLLLRRWRRRRHMISRQEAGEWWPVREPEMLGCNRTPMCVLVSKSESRTLIMSVRHDAHFGCLFLVLNIDRQREDDDERGVEHADSDMTG